VVLSLGVKIMLKVVVVEIEGEINLGFIIRLCKNFLVDELALVRPRVDPWSSEVLRFAAQGADFAKSGKIKLYDSLDDALKDVGLSACTSAIVGFEGDILRRAIELEDFVRIAQAYERIAVVFGRESVGLTRNEIAKCDLLVHIAANPEYPTLNLSHAVAIVLYALYKALSKPTQISEKISIADENALRIAEKYIDDLVSLVASDEHQRQSMTLAMHRFLRRAALSKAEVGYITTFIRRVYNKLRECLASKSREKAI